MKRMKRWISLGATGIALSASMAAAQTTPSSSAPPPASTSSAATSAGTTSPGGAFDKLSPGGQRIARALFEAQRPQGSSALSLDDIASRKLGGRGWGEVFKGMKRQGLVQEKNLGQVISRANRHAHPGSLDHETLITTGNGRSFTAGERAEPELGNVNNRSDGHDGHRPKLSEAHRGPFGGAGRQAVTSGSGREFRAGGTGFARGGSGKGGHGKD